MSPKAGMGPVDSEALRRDVSKAWAALRSQQRSVKHSVDRSEGRSLTERLGDLDGVLAMGPTRHLTFSLVSSPPI